MVDGARALHKELAFFSAIAGVLRKHGTTDKKRTAEQKNSALKQTRLISPWSAARPTWSARWRLVVGGRRIH